MLDQYNPFKENRAEQMTDLWKYYVPVPGIDNTAKPLIVEGGRGSGKTMFFLCNSWKEKLNKYEKEEQDISLLLDEQGFVGIYYRVDTSFVPTMKEKNRNNWDVVFETYLSICLIKEVAMFINAIYTNDLISEKDMISIYNKSAKKFDSSLNISSYDEMIQSMEICLDSIEDIINSSNSDTEYPFRYVKISRTISLIINDINNLLRKELLFKVFIDEYETLLDYQQRIINTLIKHSNHPVIFNIGLRPEGMRIKETISDTESIEAPHDFEFLELGISNNNYISTLKEICKKRIVYAKESDKITSLANDDIEFYLGKYDIDEEIKHITSSNVEPIFLEQLRNDINRLGQIEGLEQDQIEKCIESLCNNTSPLNARLHSLLLQKHNQYTPKVSELLEEYEKNTERYREWLHNRKFGIIFLLARDYKKSKQYYGFDVYSSLSSGIVRYFLELCENAFKFSYLNDFSWENPIPSNIQNEAAKYVSGYKIRDVIGYKPFGRELRVFVQYLGQIFQELHLNSNLGEPEPNHFFTDDLSLEDNISEILSSSFMWNVLQANEANKRKEANLSLETLDYHMNKIYTPYFSISYRDKRKIKITYDNLKDLLSGDVNRAKNVVNSFKKSDNNTENQISIFDYAEV